MNLLDKAATRSRIEQTERLIRPYIRRTPTIAVSGSDFGLDIACLVLKLELMQHTGSFKPRGFSEHSGEGWMNSGNPRTL